MKIYIHSDILPTKDESERKIYIFIDVKLMFSLIKVNNYKIYIMLFVS
jgi:hypothetical protein